MNSPFTNSPAGYSSSGQVARALLARGTPNRRDRYFRHILDVLPASVYITDIAGRITYFNEAAAALWGRRPKLGSSDWCSSWKLFWPDNRPMPHDQCPMAMAQQAGGPIRGMEVVAERPDGTRVPFIPFPTPLHNVSGALVGTVNMLVDITERKHAEETAQRLAAIVANSDDAIVSKDLNGIILSWNEAAERLFGYAAEEAIGKPVTILLPPDRHNEEPAILEKIRRGDRIDHYETIRQRKDGSLVEISLTVSPVKNAGGTVVGASKIARDITDRRRAQEQQQMLVREMDHRIKNLFALVNSIVTLSARSAETSQELASALKGRFGALARAHALTLSEASGGTRQIEQTTTLQTLIQTIVSPYEAQAAAGGGRVMIHGPDIPLAGSLVTSFALLLHEFTTNAAKYGALSTPTGRVDIHCCEQADRFVLTWQESGGPSIDRQADGEGFGSLLARRTVTSQLGGEISRDWRPEGLVIRLSIDQARLSASPA